MPLIKNFRSTTIHKAFILNAIATSLISMFAIHTKYLLEKFMSKESQKKVSHNMRMLIRFALTFVIAMIVFYSMNKIFGYGRGMLAI